MGSLLLSSWSWYAQDLVCVPKSLFPQSCGSSINPTGLQNQIPGSSQSLFWIPKLGTLWWVLEILYQCKNFFGIIVLQLVGRLLGGSVVDLTHCAFQVCCSQSPCPRGRLLLACASAGGTQTLKGRSDSVSVGSLGPGVQFFCFVLFCFVLSPPSISGRYRILF